MKTCLVCVLVLSVGSAFAQRVKENVKVRQGIEEESKQEVKQVKVKKIKNEKSGR